MYIVFDLNLTLCHRPSKTLRHHVFTLLTYCKRYAKIILWTSATRRNVIPTLHKLKLFYYFDIIITRDEACIPDPEKIKHWDVIKPESFLLQTYNINPKEVIFVEDTERKIRFNKDSKKYIIKEMDKRNDDEIINLLIWLIKEWNINSVE